MTMNAAFVSSVALGLTVDTIKRDHHGAASTATATVKAATTTATTRP